MLSKARYKSGIYFDDFGNEITLERGQFICGRKFMSEETGMTEKQVRVFLSALERAGMCQKKGQRRGQGITIITICNYDTYQDFSKYRDSKGPREGQERASQRAKQGPHSVTPVITPVEPIKKETKVSQKNVGSRLSDDWFLPKEYGEWALSQGMLEKQIRLEADKFKDYWISLSGAKATKRDWLAVWRNWIRRNFVEQKNGANGRSAPVSSIRAQIAKEREAQRIAQ